MKFFGSTVVSIWLAVFIVPASPGWCGTHVLAVGINDYEYEPTLSGAAPDAKDIANTLKTAGARVTLLLDAEATRENVEKAWSDLVSQAKAGDTLIFSYAGHGGQEPDLEPLDEVDGLDEAFLLAGFHPDPRHAGFRQRLTDDTVHRWFQEADQKSLKVIFVADACHSGTMTRGSLDPRAKVVLRGRPPYGLPQTTSLEELKNQARQPQKSEDAREADLKNVTFLSATQEDRKAPEVSIPGIGRRGALSFVFARAIEGEADSNEDGVLTRAELEIYVKRQVRQISEAQQAPELRPRGRADASIIEVAREDQRAARQLPSIKLFVHGSLEQRRQAAQIDNVILANSTQSADLIWDGYSGDVISAMGDPIAHDISSTSLRSVVDKWRVLGAVKQLIAAKPLDVFLRPGDKRHHRGKRLSIVTAELQFPYLTVIDLQPDGSLALLYPLGTDKLSLPTGTPFRIDGIEVREPFGADHILVFSSDRPFRSLNGGVSHLKASTLLRKIETEIISGSHQIGLLPVYTMEKTGG